MATTNFNLASGTTAVWGGAHADGAGWRRFMSFGAEVTFTAVGTDCTAKVYVQDATNVIDITVDGVTTTPTFETLESFISQSLFSGLADVEHTVTIKLNVVGNRGGRFFLQTTPSDLTIQLTGAAPAIGTPSPFGATRQVYTPATDTTNFRQDGEWSTVTAGNMTCVQNGVGGNIYAGGIIRFSAKTDAIILWGFSQATQLRLLVDGTPRDAQVIGEVGNLAYRWFTFATGLDEADFHTYEILVDSNAPTTTSGGSQMILYQVLLQGSTGLNGTPVAAKNQLAVYGDSISSPGFWPTEYDALESWCHGYIMARNRGLGYVGCGIPATTVSSTWSAALSGESRVADLTRLGTAVTHCVVHYGINDVHFGVAGATFQTAYQAMMTALLAGLTECQFYCLGVLPQNPITFGLDAETIAAQNARIVAAIAALESNRVTYLDPTLWPLNPPNGNGEWELFSDGGVHPNAAGYALIAACIETAIAGGSPQYNTVATPRRWIPRRRRGLRR